MNHTWMTLGVSEMQYGNCQGFVVGFCSEFEKDTRKI